MGVLHGNSVYLAFYAQEFPQILRAIWNWAIIADGTETQDTL